MSDIKEITDIVGKVTFPAYKEDIILHAEEVEASEDALEQLAGLPDQEFLDEMDVWDQLGIVIED